MVLCSVAWLPANSPAHSYTAMNPQVRAAVCKGLVSSRSPPIPPTPGLHHHRTFLSPFAESPVKRDPTTRF